MKSPVFRMQDKDGRGPWKPGFSDQWLDQDRKDFDAPDVLTDFGLKILREIQSYHACGFHCGCACRDAEQLAKWFTPSEMATLRGFGYEIVSFIPTKIVAESDWQIVFAHNSALKRLKPMIEVMAKA